MRLLAALLLLAPLSAADYDLLIRNARVIDGSGNPWFRADVAIHQGRIAAIGRIPAAKATQVIDAREHVLAPGFIDVHTHLEGNITTSPGADNFLYDGVTTAVTGNCGNSETNLPQFFRTLSDQHIGFNVASLVGHNAVRRAVMGEANRAPTPEELARMQTLVTQAMRDGAVGLSTGLIYIPGTYSKTDEIIALAKTAAAEGGLYATHMRSEGDTILNAVQEACEIGRQAQLPVEISHLKVRNRTDGLGQQVLDTIARYRRDGLDVVADQYPYPASSTTITTQLPSWALADGRDAIVERLRSPETRKRIIDEMLARYQKQGEPDLSFIQITFHKPDRSIEGKRITEINKLRGREPGIRNEIETVLDIVERGGAGVIYFTWSPPDVDRIMRDPSVAVASDAGAAKFGDGMPHPRAYGTNARVLGEFVRDRGVIRLEDAIRKMTSLPARTFRILDRGEIRIGNWADLVLFDPANVRDRATFTEPHQYSEGFDYVLVNGTPVITEGKRTTALPGVVIRRQN